MPNSDSDSRASPFLLQELFVCQRHSLVGRHPTSKMVLISSKTLIQAHAVILIIVAGYLIKSPEFITDSDLVFMMGEALQIV